jgi:anti-sigma-K factor RskA
MIPTDPDELDLLAGEYVLGTLEARHALEVKAALDHDPGLKAAVARWESRLNGLAALVPPEPPPPDLWSRVVQGIAEAGATPRVAYRRRRSRLLERPSFWRWTTAGFAAAAAALALLLVRPAPPPERYLAVLQTESTSPAWVVEGQAGGGIVLTALNPRQPEPGRALELWGQPPGATAPRSLGLIPPEGRVALDPTTVQPRPGMLIAISLEPPGGSPTGQPTGPILFVGRLEAVPR